MGSHSIDGGELQEEHQKFLLAAQHFLNDAKATTEGKGKLDDYQALVCKYMVVWGRLLGMREE